jgi:hypothetical protein
VGNSYQVAEILYSLLSYEKKRKEKKRKEKKKKGKGKEKQRKINEE